MKGITNTDSYNALKCDNNYLTIKPDASAIISNNFSVEVTFMMRNNNCSLIKTANTELAIENGYIVLKMDSVTVVAPDFKTTPLELLQWYNVLISFDAANIRIYLGGYLVSTVSNTKKPNFSEIDLGKNANCYFSRLLLYNIALSEADAKANLTKHTLKGLAMALDMTGAEIKDTSSKHNLIKINGLCATVNLTETLAIDNGAALYPYNSFLEDYTVYTKIYIGNFLGDKAVIFNNRNDALSGNEVGLIKKDGKIFLYLNDVAATVEIELYSWYNIALTKTSTQCKLYVNGNEIVSTGIIPSAFGTHLVIGARLKNLIIQAGTQFNGYIDYAAIFKTALTVEKIKHFTEYMPSILSQNIAKLLYFKDGAIGEAIEDEDVALIGNCESAVAESLNPNTVQTSVKNDIYEDLTYWNSLSSQEKWKVKTTADILQKEQEADCAQLEYEGSAVWYHAMALPIALVASKYLQPFFTTAENLEPIRLENLDEALRNRQTNGRGGGRGTATRGGRRAGAAQTARLTTRTTATTATTAGGASWWKFGMGLAGVAFVGGVIAIIVNACKSKPDDENKIKITKLTFRTPLGTPSQGAIHLRKNHDTSYNGSEYDASREDAYSFCYVKDTISATPQYTIEVKGVKPLNNVVLSIKVLDEDTSATLFSKQTAAFNTAVDTVMTLNANFDYLSVFPAQDKYLYKRKLQFVIYLIDGETTRVKTINLTAYSIPSIPRNTWQVVTNANYDSANVQYVWTDFLDYLIPMKNEIGVVDMQDPNYIREARVYMQGLFTSGLRYHPMHSYATDKAFRLKSFLTELAINEYYVNCEDCAFLLKISLSFWYDLKILKITNLGVPMQMNQIISIGQTASRQPQFDNHMFNALSGDTDGYKIFDLCMKVNKSATPNNPNPSAADMVLPFLMPYQVFRDQQGVSVPANYQGNNYKQSILANGSFPQAVSEMAINITFTAEWQ